MELSKVIDNLYKTSLKGQAHHAPVLKINKIVVATIIWTPTFEWYVVRCGSSNEHPHNMCLEVFVLHPQNILTILPSMVNMIGGGGG